MLLRTRASLRGCVPLLAALHRTHGRSNVIDCSCFNYASRAQAHIPWRRVTFTAALDWHKFSCWSIILCICKRALKKADEFIARCWPAQDTAGLI
jgi:hypothetical protein